MVSYYLPGDNRVDLEQDTAAVIRELQQQNTQMTVDSRRETTVDGHRAIITTLNAQSPYENEREVDALVTVARPEGLFYLVFIAPGSEFQSTQAAFSRVLGSIRFN